MPTVSPRKRVPGKQPPPLSVIVNQSPIARVPERKVDPAVLEVVARNVRLAKRRSPRNDLKLIEFPADETAVRARSVLPIAIAEEAAAEEAEAPTPHPVRPTDDTIQEVAVGVTKEHYLPQRRTSWGKLVHAYCSGMVGYGHGNRETVELYLHKRLADMIEERRAAELAMHEDGMEAELTRKAVGFLDEIEETLVELVKLQGRKAKANPTQPECRTAVLSVGFTKMRQIFVIFRSKRVEVMPRRPHKHHHRRFKMIVTEIVSVKSAREYRRSVKHRFSQRERTDRQQEERSRRNRHVSDRWEFRRSA